LRRADAHASERSPVDLGLFSRLELDAQIRFARALRPDFGDIAPDLRNSDLAAARAKLLMQAHR
jgi:hypothetical protein